MNEKENVDVFLQDLLNGLEVGIPLQLMPEKPDSEASGYTVSVRGWDDSRYIVTTLPGRDPHKFALRPGLVVTARLLAGGAAFGFHTRIMKILHRPVTMMLLQFPTQVAQKEVRAHKRIPVLIITQLVVKPERDGGTEQTGSGTIRDLGEGGCCIECDQGIEVGSKVQFSFVLPNGEPIKDIVAEVMNRRAAGGHNYYGMRFIPESSPESFGRIEQLFKSGVLDRV